MKIESLTLERYGLFTDRVLTFRPDASLHVVFGANEAGKTSMLSAIGDLLFGFGHTTSYDFKHDSRTLRIGGALRHSDGRLFSARRRKGTKNTLSGVNDETLPDDYLAPFVGGMTRDGFGREFGLTAQALRQGGVDLLKAGGSLAETLAASSAGVALLSQRREVLKAEADEMFTPRKTASRPFYLALDRYDAAATALKDAVVTRESLSDAEAAVTAAQTQLDAFNSAHAATGSDLARWQRTLRVRGKLARLESLRAEIDALSDLPEIATSTFEMWRAALADDTALANELQALDATDAGDADSIAALAVDDDVLAAGAEIDALRERLGAVRKAIDDLPRRRQARQAAQDQLTDAARRLGLASHADVLTQQPTDAALAQARAAIDAAIRAERDDAQAMERRARILREVAEFDDEGGARTIADPEPLRQRLDALADVPAQADRQHRDAAALALEQRKLGAAVAALDPHPGELTTLTALPLPDHAAMTAHARVAELADGEIHRLIEAIAASDAALAATQAELTRLSGDGMIASKADLHSARHERDAQMQALKIALDGDRAVRAARLADVETASAGIDRVTDRLLTDSERATLREAALARRDQQSRERDASATSLARLQTKRDDVEASWKQSWAASKLSPRSPADMLRWRDGFDQIVARLGVCHTQQAELEMRGARLQESQAALLTLLVAMGRTPDASLSAELLYREAKSRLDELQKHWINARERDVARRRADRDLAEANAAVESARQERLNQQATWPAAMASIGQSPNLLPVAAEGALAIWHSVPLHRQSFDSEGHRAETIEADLAMFDRDVAAIAARIAPDSAASSQQALADMAERLADTRRNADACQRLRAAATKRAQTRQSMTAKRHAMAQALADACAALGVSDITQLSVPLDRLASRQTLIHERATQTRELQDIADGRDEATLRAEQDGVDLDSLPAEIARATQQQEQVLADMRAASAQLHQAEQNLAALTKGRDVVAAAAARAEAGADLADIAERWLLRAAAARLATRAIERHRALVQDPLIARASALFALASNNAFNGLAIDYGNDDQPSLMARRIGDDIVQIAGLSEGTRDQLFLALRLALLETRTSEPMPFIGDDLLTSFDEPRTSAALGLLAAAGRDRQMILFTHHRYVADLAAAQGDGVDVIRL